MERFLYSVNPKRPIKNLPGVPIIRSPKSLHLSKDEVRECLKCAIVHRRFANESRIERVLISNVDRLHNVKFMTEEEYAKFLEDQIDNKVGTVINTGVVTPPVPEIVKDETANVAPTKVTEASVVESNDESKDTESVSDEEDGSKEDTLVSDETEGTNNTGETSEDESKDPEQSVDNNVVVTAPATNEEDGSEKDADTENSAKKDDETVVVPAAKEEKKETSNSKSNKNYGGRNNHRH